MKYFFGCNGNFIIHMEKILHEIDSIWKNYYIIKFPWNKYYAGTNISSQTEHCMHNWKNEHCMKNWKNEHSMQNWKNEQCMQS